MTNFPNSATTEFPVSFSANGELFYRTEKYRTRIATGEQAAEYQSCAAGSFYIWLTAGGEIYPE